MFKSSAYETEECEFLKDVFNLHMMVTTIYDDIVLITEGNDRYLEPKEVNKLEKVIEEHRRKKQRYEVAMVLSEFAPIEIGDFR